MIVILFFINMLLYVDHLKNGFFSSLFDYFHLFDLSLMGNQDEETAFIFRVSDKVCVVIDR